MIDILNLSLRDLSYVLALAEYRHFGNAAEACAVSQPALSKQIRRVEEVLGVTLFERTKRQVLLTDVGQEIVTQARQVMDEAERLRTIANRQMLPLEGLFRLAAIATVGPYLIPHFLIPLTQTYPQLELILTEGLTENLVNDLKTGRIDAMIASPPIEDDMLLEMPLYFEPFLLAVNKKHPMALRPALRPADLKLEELLLLEDGHCLRDQVLDICPSRSRGKAYKYQATSLETLQHMVASNMGYSLIPQLAEPTEQSSLQDRIDYRSFGSRSVGRTVSLYTRKHYARPDNIQRLHRLIAQHLPATVEPVVAKVY